MAFFFPLSYLQSLDAAHLKKMPIALKHRHIFFCFIVKLGKRKLQLSLETGRRMAVECYEPAVG